MKLLSLLLASLGLLCPAAALTEREYQQEFTNFVQTYEKSYSHEDFFHRYNVFKSNLDLINQHNLQQRSYFLRVNQFADLELHEFAAMASGFKKEKRSIPEENIVSFDPNVEYPSSLDWVSKGAVTGVKNQGSCGSCWSFSVTGATEGAHKIKNGNLVSLSEQELVDCTVSMGNRGCNGGVMQRGFDYIREHGITTESAYPYTAKDGTCHSDGKPIAARLSGYSGIGAGRESDLLPAVNIGPVSIGVHASSSVFQFYGGGVLDNPACGTATDHGVLLAGYGNESGKDFWLVKNSWGEKWGDKGYLKIVRGKNMCGISNDASYPHAA